MTLPQMLFEMRWEKHIFLKQGEGNQPCFLKALKMSSNKCNSMSVCFLPLLDKVNMLLWKNRHYFIQELIWTH